MKKLTEKDITLLLAEVPSEDLLPVESVLIMTIADKYPELGSVSIGFLNSLIDKERAVRKLPEISWQDKIRQREVFVSDMLELKHKAAAYDN